MSKKNIVEALEGIRAQLAGESTGTPASTGASGGDFSDLFVKIDVNNVLDPPIQSAALSFRPADIMDSDGVINKLFVGVETVGEATFSCLLTDPRLAQQNGVYTLQIHISDDEYIFMAESIDTYFHAFTPGGDSGGK